MNHVRCDSLPDLFAIEMKFHFASMALQRANLVFKFRGRRLVQSNLTNALKREVGIKNTNHCYLNYCRSIHVHRSFGRSKRCVLDAMMRLNILFLDFLSRSIGFSFCVFCDLLNVGTKTHFVIGAFCIGNTFVCLVLFTWKLQQSKLFTLWFGNYFLFYASVCVCVCL